MRWTEEQLAQWRERAGSPLSGPARRSKYKAEKCTYQGLQFDSIKEMRDYKTLELQRAAGAIRGVARQVSITLPGSTRRVRIDFMVIQNDGVIRWLDSKGYQTPEFQLKQKLVRDAYGLEIETI